MVNGLVDSAVLIDILRGYPLALSWYQTQADLAVGRFVWFELIQGAKDSQGQRDALKLMARFQFVEAELSDVQWSALQLPRFRLSHGVDAFDCLIAASAHRLQVPLYTRNLKHFSPLLSALAVQPY